MNRIAGSFMKAAAVFGVPGIPRGVSPGALHTLALQSVHSHLGLRGRVTFARCGLPYRPVPAASPPQLEF